MPRSLLAALAALAILTAAGASEGQQPSTLADNTRLMAIGDSITAGYGAVPVTGGYAYILYREGVYDAMTNTLFANAAVPGATSAQVLALQVPAATQIFYPHVIVMTVGGNDLLSIFKENAQPQQVLAAFGGNLSAIFAQVCTQLPDTRVYIGNLYSIDGFPAPTDQIVPAFNQVVDNVSTLANATVCGGRVRVADIYSAFGRSQQGLLMFNRPGAHPAEPHPTNAGHRAIADAFITVK